MNLNPIARNGETTMYAVLATSNFLTAALTGNWLWTVSGLAFLYLSLTADDEDDGDEE